MPHRIVLHSARAASGAVATLALLAAAVGAQPAARRGPPEALTTTLRVTPASVAPGGRFTVHFALRNPSRQPVQVMLSCTAPATLSLLAASGGEALNGSGCGEAITTRTLAAGQQAVVTMEWRAESLATSGAGRPLPSGRYVVEATPTVLQVDGRTLTLAPVRATLRVR